jgi:hypothetical protein
MGDDCTFKDGWMRFWGTFTKPLPVVFGFAIAGSVSEFIYFLITRFVFGKGQ